MIAGRLKIINASKFPTDEVEVLVRFGLGEIDLKGKKLLAIVTDTRKREYRGWANLANAFADVEIRKLGRKYNAHYIIQMMIGHPAQFPIKPYRRNGNTFDYQTWQECLVGITAHEGMHVQHYYDGAYTTKSGERFNWSAGRRVRVRVGAERIEPKCEAHELFMLRKYREAHSLAEKERSG